MVAAGGHGVLEPIVDGAETACDITDRVLQARQAFLQLTEDLRRLRAVLAREITSDFLDARCEPLAADVDLIEPVENAADPHLEGAESVGQAVEPLTDRTRGLARWHRSQCRHLRPNLLEGLGDAPLLRQLAADGVREQLVDVIAGHRREPRWVQRFGCRQDVLITETSVSHVGRGAVGCARAGLRLAGCRVDLVAGEGVQIRLRRLVGLLIPGVVGPLVIRHVVDSSKGRIEPSPVRFRARGAWAAPARWFRGVAAP